MYDVLEYVYDVDGGRTAARDGSCDGCLAIYCCLSTRGLQHLHTHRLTARTLRVCTNVLRVRAVRHLHTRLKTLCIALLRCEERQTALLGLLQLLQLCALCHSSLVTTPQHLGKQFTEIILRKHRACSV